MHNSIFDNLKKAEQGAKLSILSYLFLTILKLGAGFIFRSSALVADGINNATDVISSICVLVGLKIYALCRNRSCNLRCKKNYN